MKYLKEFNSLDKLLKHYESNKFIMPNVFTFLHDNKTCIDMNEDDDSLLCIYDLSDSTNSDAQFWTTYNNNKNMLESITIDGKLYDVTRPPKVSDFNSNIHIVKFNFKNKDILGDYAPLIYNNLLKYARIPKRAKKLGGNLFNNCSGLKEIRIPNNIINTISYGVFGGCSSLKYVYYDSPVQLSVNVQGCFGTAVKCFEFGPNGHLDYAAFSGCNHIEKIILGNSITSILNRTFIQCTALKEIIIPETVTSIGTEAFAQCISLNEVILPSTLTSIGESAFKDCTELETLSIPESISTIGDNAFTGTKLGYIENGIKYLDTPNNILALSVSDTSLTSYNIKNGTTRIEFSADTWYEAENVRDITLPNSLTYISENAFNNIIGHILTDNQVNFVKQINSNINIPYYLRINDYNKSYFNSKYFTIIPEKSGVITFNNTGESGNLYYSKDLGNTWVEMKKVWKNGEYQPNTLSVNAYEGIIFKSKIAPNTISNNDKPYGIGTFSINVDSQICGNIASLMYEGDFSDKTTMTSTNTYFNFYNFANLFNGNQNKLDVEKLILPFTSLTQGCYMYMFKDCVKLINTPTLPATTLANNCYYEMFYGCTSLITPPSLPASVLTNAQRCYRGMFQGCTSLTTAPELPGTTLSGAKYCYANMFENCTSLTESPILRAREAPVGAYKEMFKGCSSLNKITLLTEYMNSSGTDGSCTTNWVEEVSQTGTFIKKANPEKYSTLYNFGYGVDEIPVGWTVQDYVAS